MKWLSFFLFFNVTLLVCLSPPSGSTHSESFLLLLSQSLLPPGSNIEKTAFSTCLHRSGIMPCGKGCVHESQRERKRGKGAEDVVRTSWRGAPCVRLCVCSGFGNPFCSVSLRSPSYISYYYFLSFVVSSAVRTTE